MAGTPAFNIFTAYESLACALRVKEILDRLTADLKSSCRINTEFWNFSLLRQAEFRKQAGADVRAADMIIVAAPGGGDLAEHVRNWMEDWMPRRQSGHAAMVVLLDDDSWRLGEAPPPCDFLQELAARCNMEFFCQAGSWQPAQLQFVVESVHRDVQLPLAKLLEERAPRHEAFLGWGIND